MITSVSVICIWDSHFRRFWLRPAILRHHPGLAASPPVRYMLKVAGDKPRVFFEPEMLVPAACNPRRAIASGVLIPGTVSERREAW